MKLKTHFRLYLISVLKKLDKRPSDIYKNSSHYPSYVSDFLKDDTNHSLDVIEGISNALDCYTVILFIPKSDVSQIDWYLA